MITCFQRTSQIATATLFVSFCFSLGLSAQSPSGPTNLPAPPNVVRLPNRPAPEQAPLPPAEIIRRFGQTEDATAAALGQFTYKKTIRMEELGSDGKPSGRAEVVTQMTVEEDGSRRMRPVGSRSESTLNIAALEPDSLEVLNKIPTFPFTTAQIEKYDITFQASEPVDALMTYVFRVTPRQLSRTAALFSGVIWVDDHDFAVVKTFGKWVSENGDITLVNLPFNYYETYRSYVAGKYWMPSYVRSDGTVSNGNTRAPARLTIRWEEYKQIPGTTLTALPQFAPAAPADTSEGPTAPTPVPPATPASPASQAAPANADPNRPSLGSPPGRR
jgi:hypothetical protein